LSPEVIGEYTGDQKDVRPITVATYQILTYHPFKRKKLTEMTLEEFPHLALFTSQDWGLIIYDEVHLLPAPVFRITAEIQARRRLGLTATLVREDGREGDVFSLIGPKKFDVPWKSLEEQGWIAAADCWEIRVALPAEERMEYALVEEMNERHRLAAVNPAKEEVLRRLVAMHREDHVLVIGQYLDQLDRVAGLLDAPLITGKTPNRDRERLYAAFRAGDVPLLVISKVGNFAIDLPSANVAIQLSGTFGSRQEEAQRLGRVLRPKEDGSRAHFYSVVTRETSDQGFAANRQLFLTEQGYRYTILDATVLLSHDPAESLSGQSP
ncbi:MAG TPA: DEAD/DEAH box helicase, partial [Dehalococcoidia bacterium]|nr:DEAD/DEAH box helicase [Dehalococcoidia bacterium]